MYDEDTIDINVGIHDMSTSSEISEAAIEAHDEMVETEKNDMQDEDCMEELERREMYQRTTCALLSLVTLLRSYLTLFRGSRGSNVLVLKIVS